MTLNPRFVVNTVLVAAICFLLYLSGVGGATAIYPLLGWLALVLIVEVFS
mgnify:CR=1 FL=1